MESRSSSSRIAKPDPDALPPDQKEVYDIIKNGPRGFVGWPILGWLKRPDFCNRAQHLGLYSRYGSSLPPRLSELAIMITERFWGGESDWWGHKPIAIKEGVSPEVLEALRQRKTPHFEKRDERVVYDLAMALFQHKRVTDVLYAEAIEVLGEDQVIDLTGLFGYYSMIAFSLLMFDVSPPPEGVGDLDT